MTAIFGEQAVRWSTFLAGLIAAGFGGFMIWKG